MNRILTVLMFICLPCFMWAQGGQNKYTQYIQQYKDVAIQQMLKYRIPASITLAQGLLESGAGQSELARKGNNHFGIKCHGWQGRTTYHDDDAKHECFRAYDSALQSYEDHSIFLTSGQRYRSLFSLPITDYKGWANGLKAAGYATNPQYAYQLISVIEQFQLWQYDDARTYDKSHVAHTSDIEKHHISIDGITHDVNMCNKNYYIIARTGDTFRSLGKEFGVSYKSLARYNELDQDAVLRSGDIIYLQKKRTRADRQFKNIPHEVLPGQSMYLISQKYGIRLKNLYKMNGLGPDYQIHVGDRLRIY